MTTHGVSAIVIPAVAVDGFLVARVLGTRGRVRAARRANGAAS